MAINSNMRPAEMFQLRLYEKLGGRRQRRSPTLFSSLADALRTAGTAYASSQITQGAQDRREAADREVRAMLTGKPAVMGMVPRTRSEAQASAVGDVFGPDGLGMGAPEAPPNDIYGRKVYREDVPLTEREPFGDRFRRDRSVAPNFQGVGDTMPSLTEMVPGITTPAVSATPEQLMAAALNPDASQVMQKFAASRYASSLPTTPKIFGDSKSGYYSIGKNGIPKQITEGRQDPQSPAGKLAADYAAAIESGNPGMIKFLENAMRDPNKAFNPDGSPNLEYQAYQKELAQSKQPNISVKVGAKDQVDRLKRENKWVETSTDPDQVQAARMSEASTSMMIDMLKDADDTVFQNAQFKANVSEWLSNLGLDSVRDSIFDKDGLIKIQSFKGLLTGQVLQRQLLQKGPQTESDARRLMISLATLTNKNEANLVTLRASRALTANTLLRNEFAAEYELKNETNKGVRKAWNDKLTGAPIYLEMRFKANKDGTAVFVKGADGKNTMIPDKKGKYRSYLFFDEYMKKTTQQDANGEFLTRQQKFDLWKNFVKQYKN
jgi:hypothetical protein